jgi:hypothetical protein
MFKKFQMNSNSYSLFGGSRLCVSLLVESGEVPARGLPVKRRASKARSTKHTAASDARAGTRRHQVEVPTLAWTKE